MRRKSNCTRNPNVNSSPFYIRIADKSGLGRTDTVFSEVFFDIDVEDDISAAERRPISRNAIFGVWICGRASGAGRKGRLLLSDLAEQLGLRTRTELLAAFEGAGLIVIGRIDVRPTHPRASDQSDPLLAARAAELTSLWRLKAR